MKFSCSLCRSHSIELSYSSKLVARILRVRARWRSIELFDRSPPLPPEGWGVTAREARVTGSARGYRVRTTSSGITSVSQETRRDCYRFCLAACSAFGITADSSAMAQRCWVSGPGLLCGRSADVPAMRHRPRRTAIRWMRCGPDKQGPAVPGGTDAGSTARLRWEVHLCLYSGRPGSPGRLHNAGHGHR